MQGTLVITILTIQSSYVQNRELTLEDGAGPRDTIQWWIAPIGSWRIRTFAIDHDIHTHSIENTVDLKELALTIAQKNYGDVIQSHHVIELTNCLNSVTTDKAFRDAGLEPRLEVAAGRFAFWKPDDARYYTQSVPD